MTRRADWVAGGGGVVSPGAGRAVQSGRESQGATPRVAVLLATYNGEEWLREQLSSIAWQKGVEVEVFFADDGSTDRTIDVVAQVAGRGLVVHRVEGPRAGTAARNFARLLSLVDLSRFDCVAFSDQDDIWLATKLARAVSEMQHQHADAYACNMIAFFTPARYALVKKDHPVRRFDYLFQSASAACTYVLRRSVAELVRDVVGETWRDWERTSFDCVVYAATRSRGVRWVIDGVPNILYRQHSRNVFGANVGWRAALMRIRLLRAGWIRAHVQSLSGYCVASPDVDEVIARVERGTARDRLWLAWHAADYRREPVGRISIRLLFLLGWL